MNPKTNNHHRPDFFNGLVLGGLLGATAYYLFITQDGKKTKKILLKKGELFLQDLELAIDEAKKETKKIAKKAHHKKEVKDKKKLSASEVKTDTRIKEKPIVTKPGPKKKPKKAFSKNGKKLT